MPSMSAPLLMLKFLGVRIWMSPFTLPLSWGFSRIWAGDCAFICEANRILHRVNKMRTKVVSVLLDFFMREN